MNDHEEIRGLLPLVAAGAADAAEEKKVRMHLARCAACVAELESWQGLATGLRALPTPQPPAELVERVRVQAARELAAQAESWRGQAVIACLVLSAWGVAIVSWPAVRWMLAAVFGWSGGLTVGTWGWLVGSASLAWLMGGALLVLAARRRQMERSAA